MNSDRRSYSLQTRAVWGERMEEWAYDLARSAVLSQ